MQSAMYRAEGTTTLRRTAVMLALAGAAYIAGALSHGPVGFRDVSTAFAQPPSAAQSKSRVQMPTVGTITPAGADVWGRSDGEQIFEPRECDLERGILTACLFMD